MSGPGGTRDAVIPRLGSMFGRYRIESVIGRGGMGVVVRATDTELDRVVALKFLALDLADDPTLRQRFMREPRLAASIEHPNIVPIHDAGVIDGIPYIVMRAIRGEDLAAVLRREAPLTGARTAAILAQVADALDAAHRGGLVHRDVKAGNIILEPGPPGGPERAWLTDFGLTRRLGDATVGAGGPLGTIDSLAPELIDGGDVGPWTDQYSLACLAVHCLTGSPPWTGPTDAAVLHGHLHGDRSTVVERLPEGPGRAAVMRALAVDPAERFPDCGSFVDAMWPGRMATSIAAQTPITTAVPAPAAASSTDALPAAATAPPTLTGTRNRGGRRGTAVVAVALLLAVFLAAGAGVLAIFSGAPEPSPDPPTTGSSPGGSPGSSPGSRLPAGVVTDDGDGVIVFAGGKGTELDLWATRLDGSEPWRITSARGTERYPSVSPDGAWIAYSVGPVGDRDLWLVRSDGTDARRLTRHEADDYAPAFSPDGQRLAWTSNRDGTYDIHLMRQEDGRFVEGDAENLTDIAGQDGNHDDILPAWSPDGRWLVFSSNRAESSDIWRLDPDRPGSVRPVTSDKVLWADTAPTVDADGDVWFVGARGHLDRELYEAVDGRIVRRTALGDDVIGPDVGPDGVRIVAAVGDVVNGLDSARTRLVILGPPAAGSDLLRKLGSPDVGMPVVSDPDWVPRLVAPTRPDASPVGAPSASPGTVPTAAGG